MGMLTLLINLCIAIFVATSILAIPISEEDFHIQDIASLRFIPGNYTFTEELLERDVKDPDFDSTVVRIYLKNISENLIPWYAVGQAFLNVKIQIQLFIKKNV
jgi:hypothetical protein